MEVIHALKTGKINISDTMFKTTEGTEVHTWWQKFPLTDNSDDEKPVVSTVVAIVTQ